MMRWFLSAEGSVTDVILNLPTAEPVLSFCSSATETASVQFYDT